ncbi:MAG: endonuclease/exonuclease/phosphatase family protein [Bacteriovoracaceae bacterium]|nr:endonuclease/exonuclease/phosphatase family protein [Bacteriovoracaceae bacterium]
MKILCSFILIISFINSPSADTFKVTTYNLGLAHTFVPYAKERLAPLGNKLANYDTDVLCLQEVWEKKDQKKLNQKLESSFPYSFKTKIKNFREGSRPTCKIKEIFGEGKFVSCMQNQCGGKEGDEFTDCIINKCGGALEKLKEENRTCATALMAQVGKNPITSILTLLNPLWRAGQFAYKGSNGLMLYSKYPILEERYIDFKEVSTLNKRGALQAVIDIKGKKVQVLCTHITADLSDTVPYTGIFADWEEENTEQMDRLLQTANQKLYPTILLGDFNCGYGDPVNQLASELPGSCKQTEDWGFSDPLSEQTKECTFCKENLLNDGEVKSVAIDHIFLKDLKARSGRVLFKEQIKIETKEEGMVKTQLSDHFGYEVVVDLP